MYSLFQIVLLKVEVEELQSEYNLPNSTFKECQWMFRDRFLDSQKLGK